ncbi:hypothetical protein SNE40_022550 [Patella caerulea]|uniref:Glycoprotein-N-acetylgalactosamine 3-beta-galactosyltransferase 1 n=1 Tax=Patella caerulea TaxID=87958 RepID=A0AAN8IXR9_PATCE
MRCYKGSIAHIQFLLGIAIGIVITFFFSSMMSLQGSVVRLPPEHPHALGERRLAENSFDVHSHLHEHGQEHSHEDLDNLEDPHKVEFEDTHFHHDDESAAKRLSESTRVLCWIMTSPKTLEKKARHVKNTWGKRCNILLFFSSETNTTFPTIGLNVSEGRNHLTGKTIQAFKYIYDKYYNQADWFMKADDDTYVIVENLRYFLSGQNTSQPVYFGHRFKVIVKQGYYSGGAGYVLSKEALRRFGLYGNDTKRCRQDGGAEDAEIGKCLYNLGVSTGNSLDALGRTRFHCFNPETHLFGGFPPWYYKYDNDGAKKGTENISDYAISFHYIPAEKMYSLEFYIYHLRPYGIISQLQNLNNKPEVISVTPAAG